MHTTTFPYRETGYFSKMICDYLDENDQLRKFYSRFPNLENFADQIEEKSQDYDSAQREILVKVLREQYSAIETSEATTKNIQSLAEENTFTITTGHQLNLFSGPLYFLYKIVSVLNLCRALSERYTEYNFVPIFWMATEDHDFEEINFFRFQGKKVQWNRESGGAVGELDNSGLEKIYETLKLHFGEGGHALELLELFENAYLRYDNLADATRYLANALFGNEGLVILDGNDSALKRSFIDIAEAELNEQSGFKHISETTNKLESAGYHKQVHAREINLFYLQPGQRERIIEQDGSYHINNNKRTFTKEELITELRAYPERFSPNALLRPIYQEAILPNLCYIGGGGEISYWLQLKAYFDSQSVPFPIVMLRNSALLVPGKYFDKLQRLNTSIQDLFQDTLELEKQHTIKISEIDIDFSIQREHLIKQFEMLHELAKQTDRSFEGAVAAQEKKQLNGLDKLEKRLLKAQRRKLKDELQRLTDIQELMFPAGNLQERFCNFSEYYLEHGNDLIQTLMQELDPLSKEFTVIRL